MGELDDIVDDYDSSVPQKRIREPKKFNRPSLVSVDEKHIENLAGHRRDIVNRIGENKGHDVVHSHHFYIRHGLIIGWERVINGDHMSVIFPYRLSEIDRRVPIRCPNFEKIFHSRNTDNILEKLGRFVRYIRHGAEFSVSAEMGEECWYVHK